MIGKEGKFSLWSRWLVYLVVAILMTWPLITQMNTHLGGWDQDIFNVFWGNWWIRKILREGGRLYFTSYLTYPTGFDLISFAFSPLLGFVTFPLVGVISQQAAYNVLVLLVIVLNCIAGERLVAYLTKNRVAALVAGFIVGFAPAVTAERLFHLNLALVAWLPWSALFLTRLMRETKLRDALGLMLVAVLAFLTRLQIGVLTGLFCAVYFLSLSLVEGREWPLRSFQYLGLGLLLTTLLLSPLFLRIWGALRRPGGESLYREARDMSADLLSYLTPPPAHPFFGPRTVSIYGQRFPPQVSGYWTYLGIVPIGLFIYGVYKRPSKTAPWLFTFSVFFLLSLGSEIQFNGSTLYKGSLPYDILENFFSKIAFDNPSRFNLVIPTALSVGVGMACTEISRYCSRRWVFVILGGLILFEYTAIPMPQMPIPQISPFYEHLAEMDEDFAIVDFPLTRAAGTVHRYYQTFHEKPIVGGWTHRISSNTLSFVRSNTLLASWLDESLVDLRLFSALDELAEQGVRYILVHHEQLDRLGPDLVFLTSALRPYYQDENLQVFSTRIHSTDALNIVSDFGEGLSLVKPYLTPPEDTLDKSLTLSTCWVGPLLSSGVDIFVRVVDADALTVSERRTSLADKDKFVSCSVLKLPFSLEELEIGSYRIEIVPQVSGTSLGVYTLPQPVHVFSTESGQKMSVVGDVLDVRFDGNLALAGYNVHTGEGALWLDLYLRGSVAHKSEYVLFVQILDPVTQLPVFHGSDMPLATSSWMPDRQVVERRLLPSWNLPPGRYQLTFGLYPPGKPDERLPVFKGASDINWPGGQVIVDEPVLVLPQYLQDYPISQEKRIIIYNTGDEIPNPPHAISVSFDDAVALMGYSLSSETVENGEPFELALFWRSEYREEPLANYKVFVHVIGDDGGLVAQHDGIPARGQQPTTLWRPGDIVVDIHELQWLEESYSGPARLMVGLYDPETLDRLPAYDGAGNRRPADRVDLGSVNVQPGRD